jgi:TetR/AcrR family transcriptional regulator, transcriptional repressor for nem operon
MNAKSTSVETREKILAAALKVVRQKGYSATTVQDLCTEAGVSKGAFFHHFDSKETMAVAAAESFSKLADGLFMMLDRPGLEDPLDYVFAYLDLRESILGGETWEYTCFLGTVVQESYASSDPLRIACEKHIFSHAAKLEEKMHLALVQRGVSGVESRELAWMTQSVLQGSFILGKASESRDVIFSCIRHLRRYFEYVFGVTENNTISAAVGG